MQVIYFPHYHITVHTDYRGHSDGEAGNTDYRGHSGGADMRYYADAADMSA